MLAFWHRQRLQLEGRQKVPVAHYSQSPPTTRTVEGSRNGSTGDPRLGTAIRWGPHLSIGHESPRAPMEAMLRKKSCGWPAPLVATDSAGNAAKKPESGCA